MLSHYSRFLPELFSMVAAAVAHYFLYLWLLQGQHGKWALRYRSWLRVAFIFSAVVVSAGVLLQLPRFWRLIPYSEFLIWCRGLSIAYGIFICMLFLVAGIVMRVPRLLPANKPFDPARRQVLNAATNAAICAPLGVVGFGIIVERRKFILREVPIRIPNLPKDLDGFTLVQLTDMHVSPFLSVRDLSRAVDMANETRAKLALVTGDLITSTGDPLDGCIRELARLRADAGVFGCLGNHEIYASCEDYTQQQAARFGMRFLRHEAQELRFGLATLNLAGVDYQRFGQPYLPQAKELLSTKERTVNLLLSHNPDVFPVAARQGWDLTLAGHTHGGQVTFELLSRQVNIARFFTPYVQGTYEQDGKSIFVSRGLGTVGVPARIGASPEVVLVKLCAT